MYQLFYGLCEKPFSLLPDPRFLYLGRPHSAAYAVLEYGVLSQAGFTVITGDVGCGKTTLIRHLLNQLDRNVVVGMITNTANVGDNLLRWILLAFRQDYRSTDVVALHDAFENFLNTGHAAGRRAVLFVDEAQNLTIETLEELRMLSNINADKDLLLQIVLVGQPQLKGKLERPELQQFAQRIVASYNLGTLSESDTMAYIYHRLLHAGATKPIFTPQACAAIYGHSGGVPRVINVLCDMALVYGYVESAPEIGLSIVRSVFDDLAGGIQQRPDRIAAVHAPDAGDTAARVGQPGRDLASQPIPRLPNR